MKTPTKLVIAGLLLGVAAAPLFWSTAIGQPAGYCLPGSNCKALSYTATRKTAAGFTLQGDAGLYFGDGTAMNTAPTGFNGFATNFVASAGANTMAFAAGDGGEYCFEGSCATRMQADGGFTSINVVSGLYSQAQVLDSSGNNAYEYVCLTPSGAAISSANCVSYYKGSTNILTLDSAGLLTVPTMLSSSDSIRSGTFAGRSSASTTLFEGNKSDNNGAIAIAFGNTGGFSTTGDQLVSWRNGGAATSEFGYTHSTGLSSLWTQHPVTGPGKRTGEYTITLNSDTTFTATKLPAPTIETAGVVASAPTADGTLNMIDFPTTNSANNASGIAGPYTTTRFDFRPRFTTVFRTGSAVTNTRILIGLSDGDVSGVSTLAGFNSHRVALVSWDTGLDTNFSCLTSDGTTASKSAIGSLTLSANTTYIVDIDMSRSGGVVCRINNSAIAGTGYVLKTTNIPTGTTDIGIHATDTTLSATALDFYIGKIALEQN